MIEDEFRVKRQGSPGRRHSNCADESKSQSVLRNSPLQVRGSQGKSSRSPPSNSKKFISIKNDSSQKSTGMKHINQQSGQGNLKGLHYSIDVTNRNSSGERDQFFDSNG